MVRELATMYDGDDLPREKSLDYQRALRLYKKKGMRGIRDELLRLKKLIAAEEHLREEPRGGTVVVGECVRR